MKELRPEVKSFSKSVIGENLRNALLEEERERLYRQEYKERSRCKGEQAARAYWSWMHIC